MPAPPTPLFEDRRHAGRALAAALAHLAGERPVVLALPRGGVPVAFEIARALRAPLDLVLVRKIGAPGNPELALGAVIDGANPQWVANPALMQRLAPPERWFAEERQRQLAELERRRQRYCGERPPPRIEGRCVILVDDGIATGASIRAALKGLAKAGARRCVVATPLAPADVAAALRDEVDELVCLATPTPFGGVGLHYGHFEQTTDEEVVELLARGQAFDAAPGAQATGAGGG